MFQLGWAEWVGFLIFIRGVGRVDDDVFHSRGPWESRA